MMRSKKYVGLAALALAAIFGLGQWMYALQGPPGPGFGPDPGGPGVPRLKQLAKQLDLTDAQKTQIKGYLDSAREQLGALHNDTSLTRAQMMNQRQQIMEQTREQIRAALTPEQQAKADELRQQAEERFAARQEKMQERMLARLTKRLNLTDTQTSTIQLALQDQRTQLQALRDNTSLTASEKFQQMQTIRQQTQEKIKSVLTADQQAQFEQLQQRMRNHRRGFRRDGPRRGPDGGGVQEQGFDL